MSKKIFCENCKKEIRSKSELITVTSFFTVVPYHEICYSSDLRSIKMFFISNQPMNGITGTIYAVICLFLTIGLPIYLQGPFKWLAVLTVIPIIYRLYSYFAIEKQIEY